ncbi:MAG: 1-acyl-sn-glycerol-3-phosphate acyltransferase [Phycisphaeraceae bacterium]|nr:1-acyl-sn-glycerol-3-phosphate acyltransferase [Phycisphaeraceae bacterium]
MRPIISEKPYRFVPPCDSRFWPAVVGLYLPRYLRTRHGVTRVECRGVEKLRSSIDAGHGVLLAPNHCRPPDPFVLGILSRRVGHSFHTMASWHLFMNGRMQAFLCNRAGAFSVYREGLDKAAIDAAIDILAEAKRPLIIFPEGNISRSNDALLSLMEGTGLIARTAAKRRAKDQPDRKVVIHPVALRYLFKGNIRTALEPIIRQIEARLSWRPQSQLGLVERVVKVGHALLGLKEIEYLGSPQGGTTAERLDRLINYVLEPIEAEWLNGQREPHVSARVKRLRMAILPDIVKGEINDAERDRRWKQLSDLYLAQQLACYPPDYVRSKPTVERLLETVERFEEDLTDVAHIHSPIEVIVEVGDAIESGTTRDRGTGGDPLMHKIEESLRVMLSRLSESCTPFT